MLRKKELLQIVKEIVNYFISLLLIIFCYFILIRQTLYFPFVTNALEYSGNSFLLILLFFPIVAFIIPFALKFFERKTPSINKHSLIKITAAILITFLLSISVDELEALVSNRDTIVTTSNWMEPSIPVLAKQRYRGTNFMWLKVSMVSFSFAYISLELTQEDE